MYFSHILSLGPAHGKTIVISMVANMLRNLNAKGGKGCSFDKIYVICYNEHLLSHAKSKFGNDGVSTIDGSDS